MPATGKHAPWRLWILILAWIGQLIFLLIALGIYTLAAIGLSISTSATTTSYVVVAIDLFLISASLILDISEIILCARLTLSPIFYLVSNVLKSAVWVGVTVASLVATRGYDGVAYSSFGIGISIGLMLLFILPMIYGAIIFHKYGGKPPIDLLAYETQAAYPPPSSLNTQDYDGAPVPRPEFVDLEDGQGHGFKKTGHVH